MATDPLSPPPGLLCKLGSIIVHAEEAAGAGGHWLDLSATETLLSDPEVEEWMAGMRAEALLPVKRDV